MLTRQKGILLFLIGASAASVGDWFHVHTGTTFYPSEVYRWYIAGIPFWIPILFGLASATLGFVYHGAKKLLGAERFNEGATLKDVLLAGLVYMALHALSGFITHWHFPLPDLFLALPVFFIWYLVDRSVGGALVCVFAGLAGAGAEVFMVHQGIFSFSGKINKLFGVATWLPWIHMAGALAIGRFVEKGGNPMKRDELKRQPHPIYSKNPSMVYIVRKKNKRRCLDEAIQKSGFISHLDDKWTNSGKEKKGFTIVIKPNFMCAAFETDISVYTDVELLEHLINRIRDQGYSKVKVVESQMVWSIFYRDRTVSKVAEMLGYSQDGYEIVDLSTEAESYDYGDNMLGKHTVGTTWKDADYRISFAKNKTHFQSYYTGCMKNVYGCLPERDKLKHYHGHRREFDGSTIAILEAFPVHFCFIDGYFSGDGLAGLIRDNTPNETNTIICGENCLAVDWVQGEKMGLDPRKNVVVRRGIERWGKPDIHGIGPLEVYKPWRNIVPGVSAVANLIEESYHLAKIFCFIFAYRMHPRFELVDDWTCSLTGPFRFCAKTVDFHMGIVLFVLVLILIFLFLYWFVK